MIFVHLWLPSKHFVPIIELVSFSLNWTWNRIGQVSWIRQKDLHILTVGETSYTNNLKFFPTHPPGRWLSTSEIYKVILPIELLDIQAFWYHYDITKSGIPTNREKFTVYTIQILKKYRKEWNPMCQNVNILKSLFNWKPTIDISDEWNLRISSPGLQDSGSYECQVSLCTMIYNKV